MNSSSTIYRLAGKLIHIGTPEQVTEKFRKMTIAIETDDRYPQKVPFDVVGKNIEAFMDLGYKVGDVVEVQFDVRGRERNGKYYSSLAAWKVRQLNKQTTTRQPRNAGDDDIPW
jgi:hypothetical protein